MRCHDMQVILLILYLWACHLVPSTLLLMNMDYYSQNCQTMRELIQILIPAVVICPFAGAVITVLLARKCN